MTGFKKKKKSQQQPKKHLQCGVFGPTLIFLLLCIIATCTEFICSHMLENCEKWKERFKYMFPKVET